MVNLSKHEIKSPPPQNMSYLKRTKKYMYESSDKPFEFCWYHHFFIGNQQNLLYQKIQIFTKKISNSFDVFWVFKDFLNKHGTILMMSAKLATPSLFKRKIFQNKGYDVIIPNYEVDKKILSHDSNYLVDVVMWPKFNNCSIFMREVIITSILTELDQKNHFFWGVVLVQVQ